jgi:hypothetical protein
VISKSEAYIPPILETEEILKHRIKNADRNIYHEKTVSAAQAYTLMCTKSKMKSTMNFTLV